MLSTFTCLIGSLYIFFLELSAQVLCPFEKSGSLSFIIDLYDLFVYSGHNILSDIYTVNMFSQSLTCLFIFLRVSFNEQEFYSLMYTVYLCFSFMVHTFYVCLENFLPTARLQKLCPVFFPRVFIVFPFFTFKSITHL